jgi:chitodextrinase
MIAAPASCASVGYADPFSTMGNNALRHNHGSHLGELGWLETIEKTVGAPGNTYTITPYFGPAGLKLVRIPRGDGTFFDLDIRTPYGSFDTYAAGSPVTVGVSIRIGVGTASPTTSPKATLLLDSTPATSDLKDAPLAVGRTMTDPVSTISITTLSVGAAGVVVQVRESIAPSTPGGLSATVDAGDVTLGWTAATDNVAIAGYRISRDGSVMATTAPGATSWTDASAAAGASYAYSVAAVDTSDNAGAAASVAVTVPGTPDPSATPAPSASPGPTATPGPEPTPDPDPTPGPDPTSPPPPDTAAPTAPEQVIGVPTATTVSLSWAPATDDTGVVGYRVTRNGTLVATASDLTWKDTARAPKTVYLYTVAALDGVGNVSSEATVTVRTLADTIRPSIPKSFHRIAKSGGYVTFDWAPSTDNVKVAKYYVYRVGRSKPVAVAKYSKIRLYTVRGAYYYVRAVDTAGNVSYMSAKVRARR